jgi:hypothetical protein
MIADPPTRMMLTQEASRSGTTTQNLCQRGTRRLIRSAG